MNVLKNTVLKKFIIAVCTVIILFSFVIPNTVHAGLKEDILIAPAAIFYFIERGVLNLLNGIMCDEVHKTGEDYEGRILVSPETIIKGKFLLMEPNIFKDVNSSNSADYYDGTDSSASNASETSAGREDVSWVVRGKQDLRKVFSRWYYALRTLAITALLSILVYVAIRMIISSASQDKAKYKMMFKDWLVALCLLFAMHYIMVGILNMSSLITDAIGTSGQNLSLTDRCCGIIQHVLNDEDDADAIDDLDGDGQEDDSDGIYLWQDRNGDYGPVDAQYGTWEVYGQVLVLGAIVVYTFIFLVKYIKRMLTILFLILIAPISCITYPIDKIADGKAQAYNRWFQEFFFQVIIQPFHLLIYVVLVASAIQLANSNVLYAIMCFAVMMPAEKFVREMFGFKDRLGSPMGDMMKAGLARDALNRLRGGGKGQGQGNSSSDSKTQDTSIQSPRERVALPGTEGRDGAEGLGADGRNRNTLTEGENGAEGQGSPNGEIETSSEELPASAETAAEVAEDAVMMDALDSSSQSNGNEIDTSPSDHDKAYLEDEANELVDKIKEDEKDDEKRLPKGKDESNSKEEEKKEPGRWRRAYNATNSRRTDNRLQKYGNTKFGGGIKQIAARTGKRAGRRAGKMVRGTIRGATTLAGATAFGLVGTMLGKGKEGAAIGGALGNKLGNKLTNNKAVDNVKGYFKTGHDAFWDNDEKNKKKDFISNANNIKLAKENYKNRHGQLPDKNQLENELENMYIMDKHRINENQFNDVLSQTEDYIDDGMNEKEAFDTSMYAALQSQDYSAKDFRDPKAMNGAYNDLYEQYIANGIDKKQAENKTKQILQAAGRMKGVKNVALPNKSATIEVDVPATARALGLNANSLQKTQIQQITDLTVKMKENGFDRSEIYAIARTVSGSNENEIITNFEDTVNASLDYITDDNARREATKYLAENSVSTSNQNVNKEMRQRLVLKSTFKFDSEEKVSAARELEDSVEGTEIEGTKIEKTQLQQARESANNLQSGKGNIASETKRLEKALIEGGSSADKAKTDAENVMKLAQSYLEI